LHERIGDQALALDGPPATFTNPVGTFVHAVEGIIHLVKQIVKRWLIGRGDRDGGGKFFTALFELLAQIRICNWGHGLLRT
jgi:hypothetical protein